MEKTLHDEDLKACRELLAEIDAHPFNTELNVKLLNEYDELIEGIHRILERVIRFDLDTSKNVYRYYDYDNFVVEEKDFWSGKITRHYKHVDIWSIPNIGIISSCMHDYRHIKSTLRFRWDDEVDKARLLPLYRKTCETILFVFRELIEGREVCKASIPKERLRLFGEDAVKVFEYARNPKYENNWTLVSDL